MRVYSPKESGHKRCFAIAAVHVLRGIFSFGNKQLSLNWLALCSVLPSIESRKLIHFCQIQVLIFNFYRAVSKYQVLQTFWKYVLSVMKFDNE